MLSLTILYILNIMTLRELLSKIVKSDKNEDSLDLSNLFNDLYPNDEIDYDLCCKLDLELNKRLKSYWVKVWYCTDTYVGYKAYFLDNELVCTSYQSGRKDSLDFEYVSQETTLKLKNFLSVLIKVKKDIEYFTMDMDAVIPDTYELSGYEIILEFHKKAMYKPTNEYVSLISLQKREGSYCQEDVVIQFSNGEQKVVESDNLLFDYQIC